MASKVSPPPKRIKVPVPHSSKPGGSDKVHDGRWWALLQEKDRAAALWDTITILNHEHGPRHLLDASMRGLYENRPPYWMGSSDPYMRAAIAGAVEHGRQRIPLNLVKSVIDTAGAMIAKNQAEIKVHTNGGNWREQKRARDLTKWVHGMLRLSKYHRHQSRSFIDGCTSRARGVVEFWADHKEGKVMCERVHPRTILWNDLEGDNPRNFYRFFPVARETLLRLFGDKHREAIEGAPQSVMPFNPAYRRASGLIAHADMVDVASAWHKGYRNDKNSGRRILAIKTRADSGAHALVDTEWPRDFTPHATFFWDPSDEGWGAMPLADQLSTFQAEVKDFVRIYRQSLKKSAAMAGAWVEKNSETVKDEMEGGDPWSVRTYIGQPPVFSAPPAMSKEFIEYILFTYDKAFGEAGFSMLQAQGDKPEGVDAAVALREMSDITSTRQVPKGQIYEAQTVDAGDIIIALSKELYAKNKDLVLKAPGTRFLEQLEWKDIDMEEDAVFLDTSATSALPTHFVGKVQSVVDMIKGGIVPKKQVEAGLGLRLLQMPDLEREANVETAGRELTNMQCDRALYDGVYIGPEPYQDPLLLLQTAQNSYLLALTMKDVPEKNLRLLERLMSQADSLRQRSALNAAPPPTPGVPGTMPQPQLGGMGPPGQAALPPIGGMPGQGMPVPALPPGPIAPGPNPGPEGVPIGGAPGAAPPPALGPVPSAMPV
jgi:hypothetical protein